MVNNKLKKMSKTSQKLKEILNERFCEHQIKAKYKEAKTVLCYSWEKKIRAKYKEVKIIPCYSWEKEEFFGCNINPEELYECPYKSLKNNNCSDLIPLINYTNLSERL